MQTYGVQIPNTAWFECNLYLEQNYIKHRTDYSYSNTGFGAIIIQFYSKSHQEQFLARWATVAVESVI